MLNILESVKPEDGRRTSVKLKKGKGFSVKRRDGVLGSGQRVGVSCVVYCVGHVCGVQVCVGGCGMSVWCVACVISNNLCWLRYGPRSFTYGLLQSLPFPSEPSSVSSLKMGKSKLNTDENTLSKSLLKGDRTWLHV